MMRPLLSRQSLFRQSVFVLFGLTLLLQLILYAVSFRLIVWPLLQSSTEDLAYFMVLSANTLERAPAARRAALRAQFMAMQHMNVIETTAPLAGQPSLLPYTQLLQATLTKLLGHDVQIIKSGNMYSVDIPADGHWVRFSFPRSRIGTDPLLTLTLSLIITLLLCLWAALIYARKLTRPLRNLSQAATRVGQGRAPQLEMQASVQELDELVRCFNNMAHQVHAMINSRTTLLAGISHDLRSPLARARLAVDLARENIGPAALDDIDRYLAQIELLLTEFLDFSNGVSRACMESTDLREALKSLCDEFDNGDPSVCLSQDVTQLRVDSLPLDRVMRNLVNNARRYGGEKPVEIRCTDVGRNVVIEVMDRGPGIHAADRLRVFEPFVRLEDSRNRATGGSGLGLSIVREICRAQGWSVDLKNRYGGGLIARVTIPR